MSEGKLHLRPNDDRPPPATTGAAPGNLLSRMTTEREQRRKELNTGNRAKRNVVRVLEALILAGVLGAVAWAVIQWVGSRPIGEVFTQESSAIAELPSRMAAEAVEALGGGATSHGLRLILSLKSDGTFGKQLYLRTSRSVSFGDWQIQGAASEGTYKRNGDIIQCSDGCVYRLRSGELALFKIEALGDRQSLVSLITSQGGADGRGKATVKPAFVLDYELPREFNPPLRFTRKAQWSLLKGRME